MARKRNTPKRPRKAKAPREKRRSTRTTPPRRAPGTGAAGPAGKSGEGLPEAGGPVFSRAPAEPDASGPAFSRAPAEPDASGPAPDVAAPRAAGRSRQHEREFLRLTELLSEDVVKLPLVASDWESAVEELIRLLVAQGELPVELADEAEAAVREREAIRPTGWKYGLAFPNGRVPGLKRIVAAVGVLPAGVDFSCRDGLPARIVVLLLFPEACYARFAPAIEDIAETLQSAPLRETLLGAREPSEVIDVIEEAESRQVA